MSEEILRRFAPQNDNHMRRFLLLFLALALFARPAAVLADDGVRVHYTGPDDSVWQALTLDKSLTLTAKAADANVYILNGSIPIAPALAAGVNEGAGLILILGPNTQLADIETLLRTPVTLTPYDAPLSLVPASGANDPLVTEIVWTSAPQVRERYVMEGFTLTPLVTGFEDGATVVGMGQVGAGRVFVISTPFGNSNPQLQEWAYFNYLIHHLAQRAAGQTPQAFADYPASPVPHAAERAWLIAALIVMVVLSVVAFGLVRRYSRAHPEVLDVLVVNRAEYTEREAHTDWEQIGFHRPLGGFLVALMLGLVFFIPLIIYQNLILPAYLLPSAQALGIWGRVTQFFALLWQFFDLGTNAAFIKFFAQHRVRDPRLAVQYGQVYVWWQALSGAVQVALIVAVAGTVLPRTAYALYTWSIIIHALIQLPGFYRIYQSALTGLQRLDYAQLIELAVSLIFPIVTQLALVPVMVLWGQGHPVFGMAGGGLFGLGLAAYATEALMFLSGLWLYRRLGYNARVLLMAHFDWDTVKSAFRFGLFEMLGSIAWGGGQAAEVFITQTRLVNYAEVWGNWGVAQNFVFAFNVSQTLYNGMMPSISEAISNGRKRLSEYYAAMAYKWGGLISAFIGAVLLAVADRFILGATGPEFTRAAVYVIPLIFWGAAQYPSWVADAVQLGSNRPYLKSILIFGEQLVRVVLAWLLLERLQINALIIAYFVALFAKGLTAFVVNHRLCFPQRFYVWQSFTAPLLAGAVHYFVLRFVTGLIWQGDQLTSILIFFVAILPSLWLYAFFYGVFGGWDDATLDELRRGADLSSFVRPLARAFWKVSAWGARLSPLHNRFPITIRASALAEAQSLTEERVNL